ncbi:hypothetical protein [Paenibacillus eucommiae]|uniref:Uncharacterized protein n=1 Tax=Paenibacillus eucommiae TaxID=1355755 RepID=A0ABS4IT11_9BACL|nr:hypothetical protein [Paenibacillus eucommiae]MBP1990698.1 hypothetical protein [Paenibacillus eucommiae]
MCVLAGPFFSPSGLARGGIPSNQEKTLAGSPFDLGVRVIRAIVAKEGMAVGGRAEASAFKDLFLPPHRFHSGNKSLTAAGAHSPSLP